MPLTLGPVKPWLVVLHNRGVVPHISTVWGQPWLAPACSLASHCQAAPPPPSLLPPFILFMLPLWIIGLHLIGYSALHSITRFVVTWLLPDQPGCNSYVRLLAAASNGLVDQSSNQQALVEDRAAGTLGPETISR